MRLDLTPIALHVVILADMTTRIDLNSVLVTDGEMSINP
ncbi:hypothetical protein SynBIOSE41_01563 [Synechococcus sp. BIOS-E4-1]|nr:hypothetical protein SynBIOSE41_01563 [Synechococcus sp. BIOS-E4-1]